MQITDKYLEELQNPAKRLASYEAAATHAKLNNEACQTASAMGNLALATTCADLRDLWHGIARALSN